MARSRVRGAARLKRKLDRLEPGIRAEVKETVQTEARKMLGTMRALVSDASGPPKRVGLKDRSGASRFSAPRLRDLRSSLSVRSRKRGLAAAVGVSGKRNQQNAILAIWSNYGTIRFPKTGFMDRAFKTHVGPMQSKLREAVKLAFGKALKDAGVTDG